jgi:N-methylhydantoinase B
MRRAIPLPGLFGGYPGACTCFDVEADGTRRSVGLNAAGIALAAREAFHFANASGSGLGDPLEREPERVLADVREGYVTPGTARGVYGVVLTPDGRGVNGPATVEAREAIRAARRSRARFPEGRPADPPRQAVPIGRLSRAVEVVRTDGGLVARCTACGAGLGRAPRGWKSGAGVAECTLGTAEYAERTGAWAPLRASGPVLLREYVCPACARLLETEIALAGTVAEDDVRPAFYASPA